MTLAKGGESLRQQVAANGAAGTNGDAAARVLLQVAQRVAGFRLDGEQAIRIAHQQPAGFGEAHAARQAIEQRHAQRALELAQLLGDGRLADVQLLRPTADAAAGSHRMENGQMVEVHERRGCQ